MLRNFVRRQEKSKLFISSLPSLKKLERLRRVEQVHHLVNVSGVDIKEIYPELILSDFTIAQFDFADVFTLGKSLTDFSTVEQSDSKLYLETSELKHRLAYIEAAEMAIYLLKNQLPLVIFCHRGLARSPLVAATALNNFYQETLLQSIERVHKIHAPAYFTDISISALQWSKGQLT